MSVSIKDTPPKPPSHSINASSKATAKDVMHAVKQDLDGSVVLTSAEFFLQHILGINSSENLPPSLKGLIDKNYSWSRGRWHNLPKDGQLESEFYAPFVRLANEICNETVNLFPGDKHTVRGKWIDCHSISPTKTTDSVADIRPDCAFVPNANAALGLGKEYHSLKENVCHFILSLSPAD